eukprot:TRINITY_DN6475_c0_g1_i1.p1 TRINITY_DN6475_c0_g1~~TRINITY_DN6475_c0_g1_i1.p1  ORF type:complete len:602 (+),score=123.49 TRINITY_DN6475_c0_g1_i1:134-1939(+)
MVKGNKRKIEDPTSIQPERRSTRQQSAGTKSTPIPTSSSTRTSPRTPKPSPASSKGKAKGRSNEEEVLESKNTLKGKAVSTKFEKFSKELATFDSLLESVTKDNEYHELENYEEEVTEEDEDILKQVDSIADDQFDVKEEKIETFFTNWKELPSVSKPIPNNDIALKLATETHEILEMLTSGWLLSTFNSSRVELLLPWLYETAVYSKDLKVADVAFKTLVTLLTDNMEHMYISAIHQHNLLLKLKSSDLDAPVFFTFDVFLDTFKSFGLVLPSASLAVESRKSVSRSHSLKDFPIFNFEIALSLMSVCCSQWPSLLSIEELKTLSKILCHLLIDPTVSKCYLQVSSCLCQILKCYPEDLWESICKELARELVSMERKNYRVLLANHIPVGDRGRKLQITVANLLLCELLSVDEEEVDSKPNTIEVLLLFFSKVTITRSTDPVYYTNLLTYLSLMDLALDKSDIVKHPKRAQELKAKFQFAKDKIATLTHLSILLTKEQLSKFVTLFIVFLPQRSIIEEPTFAVPSSKSTKPKQSKKAKLSSSDQQSILSFLSKPAGSSSSSSSTSSPSSTSPASSPPRHSSTSDSSSSSPSNDDALKPLL